jgi:hypothetical protein
MCYTFIVRVCLDGSNDCDGHTPKKSEFPYLDNPLLPAREKDLEESHRTVSKQTV